MGCSEAEVALQSDAKECEGAKTSTVSSLQRKAALGKGGMTFVKWFSSRGHFPEEDGILNYWEKKRLRPEGGTG